MKLKRFSKWTADEVEEYFQINLTEENQYLKDWMAAEYEITESEEAQLLNLCKNLRY